MRLLILFSLLATVFYLARGLIGQLTRPYVLQRGVRSPIIDGAWKIPSSILDDEPGTAWDYVDQESHELHKREVDEGAAINTISTPGTEAAGYTTESPEIVLGKLRSYGFNVARFEVPHYTAEVPTDVIDYSRELLESFKKLMCIRSKIGWWSRGKDIESFVSSKNPLPLVKNRLEEAQLELKLTTRRKRKLLRVIKELHEEFGASTDNYETYGLNSWVIRTSLSNAETYLSSLRRLKRAKKRLENQCMDASAFDPRGLTHAEASEKLSAAYLLMLGNEAFLDDSRDDIRRLKQRLKKCGIPDEERYNPADTSLSNLDIMYEQMTSELCGCENVSGDEPTVEAAMPGC
jgi:hypothetical protein